MARAVREIPWDRMVRFHKEICRRSEETFFSLAAGDANSDRWSSFKKFAPENLAGPWEIPYDGLVSDEAGPAQSEEDRSAYAGGHHDQAEPIGGMTRNGCVSVAQISAPLLQVTCSR